MCRHLAYLGPPATLADVLVAPSQGLFQQAWAPRMQVSGVVNADGFGVGWYDPARRPEPARYRSPRPIWADANFASMAGVVASPAILACVRSATAPSLVEESSTPPFAAGRWLFSHNGMVESFSTGVAAQLRRDLSDQRGSAIAGSSDSEVLFALVLDRIDDGMALGDALAATVRRVRSVTSGRLNLLATDGTTIAATRCGDSLFVRQRGGEPAVTVASEPDDDGGGWEEIPDETLVEASTDRLSCRPIAGLAG